MSFLRLHLRTFVHATESEEKVRLAMNNILEGLDRAEIAAMKTEGHFGNPIIILEASTERSRDIKIFVGKLKEAGTIPIILKDLDDRMDDNCSLHFRLDKSAAYAGQTLLATDKNVIDCSLKTGAYPANKRNARKAAKEYLEVQ